MLAKVKALIPAQIRRRKIGSSVQIANNKLPIELLVEIFLYCLPTDRFPVASSSEAPILLGMICRVWRSVSLNTPQLWAKISLSCWYPLCIWESESFHRFGIHVWIRRSGNSPLSFEIEAHYEKHISAPLLTFALQAEAHRWKAVHLGTRCDCTEHILQMLCIPGKTPMLTDFRFLGDYPCTQFKKPITCASQLSIVHLRSTNNPFLRSDRFHALRELRISINLSGISTQEYSSTLLKCPLLEILEIVCPFRLHETETVVHTLQHLRTLIIEGSAVELLNSFDTPVLTSLAISTVSMSHVQSSERVHLSRFLLRCGGELQRLRLSGNFISCDDIAKSLRHTPMLELLCVESYMLKGELTALFCLQLVHFEILVTQPRTNQTLIAVDAILSQWKGGRLKECAITIIRVHFHSLSAVLMLQDVKECIQQGLQIDHLPLPYPHQQGWWVSHLNRVFP
ncbi:hypothetical protein BD410DRAFT_213162 [Rickenella mellea]|uniref:Uncharacterized protein n=1 Tax=Rickenella mellea TaxID=50990 RepID=A0A4Y7Q523_9AGAM|nr:hypothetical protein BD410DRAFT_213162 [Rickenella mellea]